MLVTGFYAGLLTLIELFLWMRVSEMRMAKKISILHGENMELADRVRRHANFVEHVPLALVLIGLLEVNHLKPAALHALGATLTVARILHPLGLKHNVVPHPLRAAGAGLTFLVTLAAAATAIWQFAVQS